MQFSLSFLAIAATIFSGLASAGCGAPPPNCIQTRDANAGFCLCSTTITSATPQPTTVTTVYSTTYTLRGETCYPPSNAEHPQYAGPPPGCVQTRDANAGYCLCTTTSTTVFPTVTEVPVTTTSTSTLRGQLCYPPCPSQ